MLWPSYIKLINCSAQFDDHARSNNERGFPLCILLNRIEQYFRDSGIPHTDGIEETCIVFLWFQGTGDISARDINRNKTNFRVLLLVERLAHRYYVDYGLAIRGLIEKHPGI